MKVALYYLNESEPEYLPKNFVCLCVCVCVHSLFFFRKKKNLNIFTFCNFFIIVKIY